MHIVGRTVESISNFLCHAESPADSRVAKNIFPPSSKLKALGLRWWCNLSSINHDNVPLQQQRCVTQHGAKCQKTTVPIRIYAVSLFYPTTFCWLLYHINITHLVSLACSRVVVGTDKWRLQDKIRTPYLLPCTFYSHSHVGKTIGCILPRISSSVLGCSIAWTSATFQWKVLCKAKQIVMVNTYTNHSCTVCCEQTAHIMLQLQDKIIYSDAVAWGGNLKFHLQRLSWLLECENTYGLHVTTIDSWRSWLTENDRTTIRICVLLVLTCHLVPWTYNILLIKI